MAFPSVSAADTQSGTQTSNATAWTVTYPTNLASGDLILLMVGRDGTGATNSATGFTVIQGQNDGDNTACRVIVMAKVSDGTETGTFTFTTTSEQGCWRTNRITGWFGAGGGLSADGDGISSIQWANAGTSPSANPEVTSLDPTNWAAEDTLWIAVSACDGTSTYTGFPTNYTQHDHATAGGHAQSSGGAGGAGLGVAYRKLNASSEDPGNFTISASEEWVGVTLGVRPVAVAAFNTQKRNQTIIAQAINRASRW